MADSAIRAEALRLIHEAGSFTLGGTSTLKQGPAIAMAILDLADAVRDLAHARR